MALPQGWVTATLEILLDYEQPQAYIVETTVYSDDYPTPVLTAGKSFIIGHTNETSGIYADRLPVIIFDDFTTATQFVTFPFKVKSSAMKMLQTVSPELDIKYLFYRMQLIRHNATTHKRYWISDYSKTEIELAPLAEQHRIVAKIDALFSELDKGVEVLQTVRQQLRTYRQAVLKWAFDREGFTYRPLTELGDLGRGKSKHRPRNDPRLFNNGKYPFVQTGEVKAANGKINDYTAMYGDFGLAQSKLWPIGTLCITIAANIAETAFLAIEACFPDSVVGFSANEDLVVPQYIEFFIQSAKQRLWYYAPATAQKNINLNTLENLTVPYCSKLEQEKLVAAIESRLSVCDKLEQIIDENLAKPQALRQSILKKAFSGQLVSQDPNDEPAEKLLERIKAAKTAAVTKTKATREKKK
jgi:type I restriction enzyme S subunit